MGLMRFIIRNMCTFILWQKEKKFFIFCNVLISHVIMFNSYRIVFAFWHQYQNQPSLISSLKIGFNLRRLAVYNQAFLLNYVIYTHNKHAQLTAHISSSHLISSHLISSDILRFNQLRFSISRRIHRLDSLRLFQHRVYRSTIQQQQQNKTQVSKCNEPVIFHSICMYVCVPMGSMTDRNIY